MAAGIGMVEWDVTDRCNLRCRHCYAASLYRRTSDELDSRQSEIALDNLLSVGVQNLVFYGGEPLLRRNLAELIRRARAGKARTYVVTNGVLLTPTCAQELIEAGLNGFGVSLDAATSSAYRRVRDSDLFPVVVGHLSSLAMTRRMLPENLRPTVSIGFVMSRANKEDIGPIIRLAYRLEADHVILTPLACVGSARDSWGTEGSLSPEEYVDAAEIAAQTCGELGLKEDFTVFDFATHRLRDYVRQVLHLPIAVPPRRCSPLKGGLFVRADGVVFPCKGTVAQIGLKRGGYTVEGKNLLKHPLSEILNSESFARLFEMASPKTLAHSLPMCHECVHFLKECSPCPISARQGRPYAEFCHDYPVGRICQAASERLEMLERRGDA
jgi:MoaA/NifB/PqqE/SkfB family radical SAM enzyme